MKMPRCGFFSVLLGIYLTAFLAIGNQIPSAYAQAGAGPRPDAPSTTEGKPLEVARTFDRVLQALRDLQEELPRTRFDPNAVLAENGPDAAAIFAWVRTQTVLVPYRGVLRGPLGVLMDRDGNSLDRALLLDNLLALAGYETRLARGQLSEDQALELVKEARAPRAPEQAVPGESTENDAPLPGPGINDTLETVFDRIERQVPNLLARLAPLRPAPEELKAGELEEATKVLRDHWWVQVNQKDAWVDLDPTLLEVGGVRTEQAEAHFADVLPDELLHRVTVRLVLETWKEEERKETNLLELAAPAAELAGKTVYLGHTPLGVEQSELQDASDLDHSLAAITAAEAWLPVMAFDGKFGRGSFFTANGEILEATDLNLLRCGGLRSCDRGRRDSGGAEWNSTVKLAGCSGTLVTDRIVLNAGPCFAHGVPHPLHARHPANPNDWELPDHLAPVG